MQAEKLKAGPATDRLHGRAKGSRSDRQVATGSFHVHSKSAGGQYSCRKLESRVTLKATREGGKDCSCECLIADQSARPLQHNQGPRMMDRMMFLAHD